jgi:phosphoglycolate phosphatase
LTSPPALIFDTDGTLLDARSAVVDAVAAGLAETYRRFGLPVPATDRDRIAGAIGLPSAAYYRAAFPPGTVPTGLSDRFAAEFEVHSTRAEVAALRSGATELYPGAEATLARLAERGHPLLLMSNAGSTYFDTVVAVHGLRRFFRRTLSLEEAERRGWAQDKHGMVRHLLVGGGAGIVIGDRAHDLEAGRAAGARTVGCLYGFGDPAELADADWRITSLAELIELPLTAAPMRTAGRPLA